MISGEPSDERPPSIVARLTSSRWFRWAERLFWGGLAIFVVLRLWPQLAALTGLPALPELSGGAASQVVGSTPAWSLTTLDGRPMGSEELRGKVVVVNFWATWCPPCRLEMPSLQALWEEAGDDVVVVGLSGDVGGTAEVTRFLGDEGITYPVGMATRELREAFGGIRGFPTTFVLARDGTVTTRVFGYFLPPAMHAAVERARRDDPPHR